MYFEKYHLGQKFQLGTFQMTEANIVAFADIYDPQPKHNDPAWSATESPWGGLIASGYQTLSAAWGLMVRSGVPIEGSLAGYGLDEVRWVKPVRPGDTITMASEVTGLHPEPEKGRGRVHMKHIVSNQHGDVVMTFKNTGVFFYEDPKLA